MKSLWPLLMVFNLVGIQAARGSPFTSASSADSNPSSAVSGESNISVETSLSWTTNLSVIPTSQNPLSINDSTEPVNIDGPVTVFKTIELIPQPLLSNSSGGASAINEPTDNLISNAPVSARSAQQSTLPTSSPPAKLASSYRPSASSSFPGQVSRPIDEVVKSPKLQPLVVGGITYAPADAHYTYRKTGLPPVVVGGLTYRPIGKEFELGGQTSVPQTMAGLSTETAQLAAPFLNGVESTLSQVQGGSMAANPQHTQSPRASGSVQIQSPSRTSPDRTSVLVFGSQTLTALPGSNGFIINSSTLLPGSPAITVNSTSYSLNPSATLTMGTSTFMLATSGSGSREGPSGALTASNETFVPLGSTAVSIDGATLSVSGPAITENGTVLSLASGSLAVGSFTFAFATPVPNMAVTTTGNILAPASPLALSGQSVIPGSPSTFVIDNETFTAYPSGLAIDGTEVFEGSTAITVSGTPISLGSSDLVIGTSTIPISSITGLGPALSSGLSAAASASGISPGPTSTSQSGKNSHHSAAGRLRPLDLTMMAWLAPIVLIAVVLK